jgi:hypothetical protein
MKKLKTSVLIFMITTMGYAQDDKSLEPLKAPAMPASSIIGAQSNEVSRPKSMKALETALLNNGLSDNGLVFPTSFAVEFNPYMLGPRKNFDYKDYLKTNKDAPVMETMARNFSFSMSTTQNFIIDNNNVINAAGFGVRTMILNGKPNPNVAKSFQSSLGKNQQFLDSEAKLNMAVSEFIANEKIESKNKDSLITFLWKENKAMKIPEKVFNEVLNIIQRLPEITDGEKFEDEFSQAFKKSITRPNFVKLQEELQNVKMNRVGLRWDIQAAMGSAFPTNSMSYSVVPRWGVWSNISYKPVLDKNKKDVTTGKLLERESHFEFIGMFRLLQNNNEFYSQFATEDSTFKAGNFVDLGGRIVYEFDKFTAEAEGIYRINNAVSSNELVQKNSLKYVFNLNYNISENVVLSYYLGKEFDQTNLVNGDLISGLSINFGFGDMKVSDLE